MTRHAVEDGANGTLAGMRAGHETILQVRE
jgi:hypothetical protein